MTAGLRHGGHTITRGGSDAPWIDYRASIARLLTRPDTAVCDGCGCELDLEPAPHSPRCKEAE